MRIKLTTLALAAAACTDPVVEMELKMPANAATFDASCVTAVSVIVAGANIAQDASDFTWACQEISPQDRLTGIHDAIRGKFELQIPDSGMAGIELYGWSGPQPCAGPIVTADLIFHSAAPYIGQDALDLEIETTMDCAKQQMKLRPVELFTLVGGATPSAASCATAAMPDGGWAGLGQIMERDLYSGVDFWGGVRGSNLSGGVASFSAATTGLAKSCLAFDADSEAGYATGCTMSGETVCAGAGEIDAPFINGAIADEAYKFDEALISKWDSMVFVSVWDNGNPKKPIAGAKVEVAAGDGHVVYVDPPATGSVRASKRGDNATGKSGLAMVYTNKLTNVKVTANGATHEVTVAAPGWSTGAALVVMP